MPTYGPWIQDPDYTKTQWPKDATTYGIVSDAYAEITVAGARSPADPATVAAVVAASERAWTSSAPPRARVGALVAEIDFTGGAFGPWSTIYRAWRDYGLMTFSAYGVNGYYPATMPPGAIGLEYETGSSMSAVVGATWQMQSTAYSWDSTIDAPANGGWETRVHAVQGVTFNGGGDPTGWDNNPSGTVLISLPKAEHRSTRTDLLDLTPHLYGPPEAGFLAITREVSGAAELGNLSADQAGFEIGSLYTSTEVTYTLRPPRYRFIYPDTAPKRQAPLRVIQRGNDGLGLSGGRRAFGGRTKQSSNRAFGIR